MDEADNPSDRIIGKPEYGAVIDDDGDAEDEL